MRSLLLIIVIAITACTPERQPVEIPFEIRLNGQPISCVAGVDNVRLTDMRMYVADISVKDGESAWQSVSLVPDDIWQSEEVVLIDLETGDSACLNGSAETNAVIRGTAAASPEAGLAFTIGVPESLNHADPLTAKAPLGYTEMHWHWASGYKFIRAGLETDDDGFFLHLGSNRCEGTIGDIKGCAGANRVRVELADFRAGENVVVIDIGEMFAGVDLQDGHAGECMSGPANDACEAPFRALGIDFSSGESQGHAPAFRAGLPE